jgi:hypothetical protein
VSVSYGDVRSTKTSTVPILSQPTSGACLGVAHDCLTRPASSSLFRNTAVSKYPYVSVNTLTSFIIYGMSSLSRASFLMPAPEEALSTTHLTLLANGGANVFVKSTSHCRLFPFVLLSLVIPSLQRPARSRVFTESARPRRMCARATRDMPAPAVHHVSKSKHVMLIFSLSKLRARSVQRHVRVQTYAPRATLATRAPTAARVCQSSCLLFVHT